MFEVGFSELLMVAFVGLIVLGPEELPKAAVKLGTLISIAKAYIAKAKSEINEQLYIEQPTTSGKPDSNEEQLALLEIESAFSAFSSNSDLDNPNT